MIHNNRSSARAPGRLLCQPAWGPMTMRGHTCSGRIGAERKMRPRCGEGHPTFRFPLFTPNGLREKLVMLRFVQGFPLCRSVHGHRFCRWLSPDDRDSAVTPPCLSLRHFRCLLRSQARGLPKRFREKSLAAKNQLHLESTAPPDHFQGGSPNP